MTITQCPNCYGEAVVSTRMRNAPEVEVWTCASCGRSWSGLECESRVCQQWAVVMCGQCNRPKCQNHGFHGRTATKQGICDACVKRTGDLLRPSKRTNWTRTGGLSQ